MRLINPPKTVMQLIEMCSDSSVTESAGAQLLVRHTRGSDREELAQELHEGSYRCDKGLGAYTRLVLISLRTLAL